MTQEPFLREGLKVEEARQEVLKEIKKVLDNSTIPYESISLENSLEKISSKDIFVKQNIPGFRASVMDGYAVSHCAKPHKGQHWKVVGQSSAGKPYTNNLYEGEAISISTGSLVPDECSWVIPIEQIKIEMIKDSSFVRIHLIDDLSTSTWIRPVNDQLSEGDIVLAKGQKITPSIIGLLASCGISYISVFKSFKIGLLISGDELISPGKEKSTGLIWESNSFLIKSVIKNLGYDINEISIKADEKLKLKDSLIKLAKNNQIVISIGGISVGEKDYIKNIINEIGSIKFWKLFLKPGRPFAFGFIGKDVPFFGLPGNPVSAVVICLQILWPVLQVFSGVKNIETPYRFKIRINSDLKRRKGRPELIRSKLKVDQEGELYADIPPTQSSSQITSLIDSDLLIEIPPDRDFLKEGTYLWAQLFRKQIL
ncbi:molybdopterin molybdotransferase MoeA [Prochlorococcus marinus]|uniref:molybdopterin molybdotransferase MoeA n=1 Tax=Prochlorococcus marinus TaxID=1219 RepID=UPI0039AF2070